MRIKIFSNFCDSFTCKAHFERVCQVGLMDNYGSGKALYITTEEDYTLAIILNTAMPVLNNIGKANVLGLAFEPTPFLNLTPAFIQYAQTYIGKYFIGSKYFINQQNNTRVINGVYLAPRVLIFLLLLLKGCLFDTGSTTATTTAAHCRGCPYQG